VQAEPEYAERLRRAFRERLMAHRTFLDDFEFVDLTLEGGYPNQRLVLLFRRTGSDDCLWGSRSANLWSRHDHPDLDWLPLDPHADVDDYVDLLILRLDMQNDGTCNPDTSGISWTGWRLGG